MADFRIGIRKSGSDKVRIDIKYKLGKRRGSIAFMEYCGTGDLIQMGDMHDTRIAEGGGELPLSNQLHAEFVERFGTIPIRVIWIKILQMQGSKTEGLTVIPPPTGREPIETVCEAGLMGKLGEKEYFIPPEIIKEAKAIGNPLRARKKPKIQRLFPPEKSKAQEEPPRTQPKKEPPRPSGIRALFARFRRPR